jgi:hypothetical protein
MATIGLDRLYYAKITENENGEETYDTPVPLAKAITAELSVELAEATLYADDGGGRSGQGISKWYPDSWRCGYRSSRGRGFDRSHP